MGMMIVCINCGERYFRCSDEDGTLCNSCKIKKVVFLDERNENNGSLQIKARDRIRKAELALLQNRQM